MVWCQQKVVGRIRIVTSIVTSYSNSYLLLPLPQHSSWGNVHTGSEYYGDPVSHWKPNCAFIIHVFCRYSYMALRYAWSVTVILSKKIDALDNRCLRRILNVHWWQNSSPMMRYALVRGSHFCPTLFAVVVCPFLAICTAPTPHKTITLHFGSSWWLETEDWPSQTILAENGGGWPATNEPRTGNVEAACSGHTPPLILGVYSLD